MSPRRFLRALLTKPVQSLEPLRRSPKFDETYPQHINSWASRLKNSVEGLRDDSTDLQKKYENAPLRRRPKKKRPKGK